MAGFRRNPYSVTVLGIMAVCLCLYAVDQVVHYARFADLQYWARQIEKGRPLELSALDRLVSETYDRGIEQECQSAFVKPFLTVLLAGLDARNPNSEYEKWFEALGQTEQFLRHTLSCLPTDGNLWVRYAMVRQASAEQSDEIHRLVGLSQRYSPAEENAITARYFLYNRLTNMTLEKISIEVRKDVEILCSPSAAFLRVKIPAPKPQLAKMIGAISPSCSISGQPTGDAARVDDKKISLSPFKSSISK